MTADTERCRGVRCLHVLTFSSCTVSLKFAETNGEKTPIVIHNLVSKFVRLVCIFGVKSREVNAR